MWALYLLPWALGYLVYRLYFVEWYKWRNGYYHIHQAVEDLRSGDVHVRWASLDKVSNVRILTHRRRVLLVVYLSYRVRPRLLRAAW